MKTTKCPGCGAVLGTSGAPTTMDQIIEAMDGLASSERGFLRAHVLARYDVAGQSARVRTIDKKKM